MSCRRTFSLGATSLLVSILVLGCATTTKPSPETGRVYTASVEKVRAAAEDALVATGFQIDVQDPRHVEGFRPRRVGIFLGSGGERAAVWLEPQGPDRVRVLVDTGRSFVGFAGQRNWTPEIYEELDRALSRSGS